MKKVLEIKECRSCYSKDFKPILSLGNQYITNFIESKEEQKKIPQVPLDLVLCDNCKLLQLKHNAPPESMWGDQYWYKSGISTTIKDDLKDIVRNIYKKMSLKKGHLVVDIGCNDGTLLEFYNQKENLILVGFEPSNNVAQEASKKNFRVINDFFNAEKFKETFRDKKAKVITAISMFYDLENPNQFLKDITSILDPHGLFVIQQNYLMSMLEQNAFDNICHEHREYYSLHSLKKILKKYDLEIFDVLTSDINGGSLRTYIKFKENANLKGSKGAEERIRTLLEKEEKLGLNSLKPYQEFSARISTIKENLMNFLRKERASGKKIWIYGASTRGNVILQYFDIDSNLVDCIADKNPEKDGKRTVGSLIPITSPEKMRLENPDILLVNTWHFFDEIRKQEEELFNKGCKFIVALPEFKVFEKN